ncbi:MAG TPA: YggT family protein [Terrimesophilobacter sp.]|nr:YggT family protein [Terrimesophilobacter sp.]HRP99322.1 YggT family protein [Terrimesophilobacter sp.]
MISFIATVVYFVLLAYLLALWVRFLVDLARVLGRNWRPKGFLLVVAELVFTITDPPIMAVRKVLPPVRMGGAALDFSWSIVMLVVIVLSYVALAFR